MIPDRFETLTGRYPGLKVAVVGDFCLDRYLEIDPNLAEVSIETGLPVHNVINVRAQPGGAGTVLNNLVALGVGEIVPIGFCGDDGEGYELRRGLSALPGVQLDHFVTSSDRRTFTYCKPLLIEPGRPPVELSRLDSKNWSATPPTLDARLAESLNVVAETADAVIVLEQVDRERTGAVGPMVRNAAAEIASARPTLPILADSRRGLKGWPPLNYKLNASELASFLGRAEELAIEQVQEAAKDLASLARRAVFVTLAERGLVGATPDGRVERVESLPLRGPIDVVGAGDSVTANLAVALAAGASVLESLELAAVASSVVIHQLGTTGTATVKALAGLIASRP